MNQSLMSNYIHIYHVFFITSLYTTVTYMYEKENFYPTLAKL